MQNFEGNQKYRTCEEYILDEYRKYKEAYDSLSIQYEELKKTRDAYQNNNTKLRDEVMKLVMLENEEFVQLVFMKEEKEQFPEIMNLLRLGDIKYGRKKESTTD